MFFVRGSSRFQQLRLWLAIFALAKLAGTKTGDTLSLKSEGIQFEPIDFPKPNYFIAVQAKDKNDEKRRWRRLPIQAEEDPSLH